MQAAESASADSPSLVRWRTAFWSAVVATPLVAGVLGVLVANKHDGQPHLTAKVATVMGAVVIANVLMWRRPRASGVALGVAALLLAVGLFWIVSLGVAGAAG